MKKIRDKLLSLVRLFKIIYKYEPLYLVFTIPQTLLSSISPIIYVYFPKLFIEQLTSDNNYSKIVKIILVYIVILVVLNILNIFLSNKSTFYADRFSKKLRWETGTITMSLSIEDIEGADFHDKLIMANNITQIINTVGLLQSIIASIITIMGLSAIITRLDGIFVLLVCTILCVKICFVYISYKQNEKKRKLYAANDRVGNYLNEISYFNQGAAKELRINNLKDWFMDKVISYRSEMLRLQYGDFKRYALFDSISVVIMTIQSFILLWILTIRFINNSINIADFTMYFNAVTALSSTLSAIVGYIGDYNQQQLNLSDFNVLEQIPPKK